VPKILFMLVLDCIAACSVPVSSIYIDGKSIQFELFYLSWCEYRGKAKANKEDYFSVHWLLGLCFWFNKKWYNTRLLHFDQYRN
jgi:hypothetical protein